MRSRGFESADQRLRIEGNADTAGEIRRLFSLAIRPTAVILVRSPEDLLPWATGGRVESGKTSQVRRSSLQLILRLSPYEHPWTPQVRT